jgi:hypothetical protein
MANVPFAPRFAGSVPAESDALSTAIKIRSVTSFRGEVKPLASCLDILRHVKNPFRSMNKDTSLGQINHFLRPVTSALLLDHSAGKVARELWWSEQEFSLPISFHACSYITWGMNNRPVGGRSSQT